MPEPRIHHRLNLRLSLRHNPPELEGAPRLVFNGRLLRSNATISLLLVFLGATSALSASLRYLSSCLSLLQNVQLSTLNFPGICPPLPALFSESVACRLTAVSFFTTPNFKLPATNCLLEVLP
jgi:hypothetical protein